MQQAWHMATPLRKSLHSKGLMQHMHAASMTRKGETCSIFKHAVNHAWQVKAEGISPCLRSLPASAKRSSSCRRSSCCLVWNRAKSLCQGNKTFRLHRFRTVASQAVQKGCRLSWLPCWIWGRSICSRARGLASARPETSTSLLSCKLRGWQQSS